MGRSLVYRNTLLYELIMLALYGRHYGARYRAVADLIPEGSSVLDLCCGPGVLHDRYLRGKAVTYTGLDVNERFVARVRRRGGLGIVWDLHDGRPLPPADSVIMQASLYQFLPDAAPVVQRMVEAARARVVLAEPVRNLSGSRFHGLARLAGGLADAGLGGRPLRFDERSLDQFIASLGRPVTAAFLIPGGREKVYVLDPHAVASGPAPMGPGAADLAARGDDAKA